MAYASQMVKKGRSLQKKVKSKTVKKPKSKPVKKTKSKPVKKTKSKTVKKTKSKRSKKTVKKSSKKVSKAKQQRGGISELLLNLLWPSLSSKSSKKKNNVTFIIGQPFYFRGTKKPLTGVGKDYKRSFNLFPYLEKITKTTEEGNKLNYYEKKLKLYTCKDLENRCASYNNIHKSYEIDTDELLELSGDKILKIKIKSDDGLPLKIYDIGDIETYMSLTNPKLEIKNTVNKVNKEKNESDLGYLVRRINKYIKLQLTEEFIKNSIKYKGNIQYLYY